LGGYLSPDPYKGKSKGDGTRGEEGEVGRGVTKACLRKKNEKSVPVDENIIRRNLYVNIRLHARLSFQL
jgi:hypothetical protein